MAVEQAAQQTKKDPLFEVEIKRNNSQSGGRDDRLMAIVTPLRQRTYTKVDLGFPENSLDKVRKGSLRETAYWLGGITTSLGLAAEGGVRAVNLMAATMRSPREFNPWELTSVVELAGGLVLAGISFYHFGKRAAVYEAAQEALQDVVKVGFNKAGIVGDKKTPFKGNY